MAIGLDPGPALAFVVVDAADGDPAKQASDKIEVVPHLLAYAPRGRRSYERKIVNRFDRFDSAFHFVYEAGRRIEPAPFLPKFRSHLNDHGPTRPAR